MSHTEIAEGETFEKGPFHLNAPRRRRRWPLSFCRETINNADIRDIQHICLHEVVSLKPRFEDESRGSWGMVWSSKVLKVIEPGFPGSSLLIP
jgi:hypothetical protein